MFRTGNMALISIRNMSMGFGGHLLFDRVSLHVEAGEKTCLVGRNGEGKSTLIKVIAGELVPDSGTVRRERGAAVARRRGADPWVAAPALLRGAVRSS